MNDESTARSRAEVADEISKWTVGGGIITMAIFPLAIPILALTAIALLPLVVPALVLGLLAGFVYLPIRLTRRLRGRRGPLGPQGRRGPAEKEVLVGVELAAPHGRIVE